MTIRPAKSALLRSTFKGLTAQYIGVLAQGVVQLGVLALLARLLTPADYGIVGLATVFITLGGLLAQFGIGVALVQRPVLNERDIRAAFTLTMGMGLALTLLVGGTATWVAAAFHNDGLTPILRALSLTFVFANLGYVAESLLDRQLAWTPTMWANLISFVLGYALIGGVLGILGFGAWALVGSQLAQTLLRSLLLLRAMPHPKRLLVDGHEVRELTRFGRGLTMARLLNYGASQGDYMVVGRVLGVTPLGFYTRAFKLMLLPVTYFAAVVTKVLFPIMARLQHEPEKLTLSYLTGSAVIGLVSAPLSALMVVLAPELVDVLLGPRWAATVPPLQVLAVGILFRNAFLLAYCLDGALGDMRKRIVRDGVYAAVVLVGSIAAVRFGLIGVAAAVLAAVVVHYVIAAQMSASLVGFSWNAYFESQWPGIALGAVVVGVAWPVRLGLRRLGLPAAAVLAATASLGTLAALLVVYLRPAVTGRYGREALRLAGDALGSRLPNRAALWLRQAA